MKYNHLYKTNRSIVVLNLISQELKTVLGETYCSLSQKEMARALGYAQHEIYQTIKELSESGLITRDTNTVRKYALTDTGIQFVKNPYITGGIKGQTSIKNNIENVKTTMIKEG